MEIKVTVSLDKATHSLLEQLLSIKVGGDGVLPIAVPEESGGQKVKKEAPKEAPKEENRELPTNVELAYVQKLAVGYVKENGKAAIREILKNYHLERLSDANQDQLNSLAIELSWHE